MAETLALTTGHPDGVAAWVRGAPVSLAKAQMDAERIAAQLPGATHVINLCNDRYRFALAWLAACLRRQKLLLPPDQSPGMLAALTSAYPRVTTVDDAGIERMLRTGRPVGSLTYEWSMPADEVVAIAFTSGSTGQPQAHPKLWRTLARNAELAAARVLGGRGAHVVATVPPQHAYGLETSVISALSAGCVLFDARPFFPEDVRIALESAPEPRTLVTTPTHLKSLWTARTKLPAMQAVVSATAPLSPELAADIERSWGAPVREIYGCTEAGVVAWRRTSASELWRAFDGGRVYTDERGAWYAAPQFDDDIALQDVIEQVSETEFFLRGRADDMIKVAGKRTSLAGLTDRLRGLPGVEDAVVFLPAPDSRPAALVVAPGLAADEIAGALAELIDPVFLPRPLILVASLPRNELGKLPREALLRAIAGARGAP